MLKTALLSVAGVLALGFICASVWAWAPDRPRAKLATKYAAPATSLVVVEGTTLRARDTGSKDAPVIVFLNGFGSSLETWEVWANALTSQYRVIRFDFAGSGLSGPDPTGDYRDTRSLSLLSALLDQLAVPKATLIGNSLGGRIAWKFAIQYPQRVTSLVLISPDGFASPGFEYGRPAHVPLALGLMKHFLPKVVFRANLAAAYADPRKLSAPVVDRYYDLLLAEGNREAMLLRLRQTVLEDPRRVLREITAPTLLLWGTQDRMIPYANARDYLREILTATLAPLDGMGHVPQEESPEQSIVPLRAFLALNHTPVSAALNR